MMTLSTMYYKQGEDHFVSWRTGVKNSGVLRVVNVSGEDSRAIAELVAIRYLLLEKEVFNRALYSGTGIRLEVSTPLIKKLHRGSSTKNHLFSYARFLQARLRGVVVDALQVQNFVDPNKECDDIESVDAEEQDNSDIIQTSAIGEVRLTKHAVDQYRERLHSGDPVNPLVSLVARLMHPDLKKQPIPDRVVDHKFRKYGSVEQTEVWGHENSQMHYVVVRDPSTRIGTVVTVYRRHQEYC